MSCTCIPGLPKPPGDETVEDLVDVEGMEPEMATLVRRAAQSALDKAIPVGPRRVTYIEGFIAGHLASKE